MLNILKNRIFCGLGKNPQLVTIFLSRSSDSLDGWHEFFWCIDAKYFSYNKQWTWPEKANALIWKLNNIMKSHDSTILDRSIAKVLYKNFITVHCFIFSIHLKNVNLILLSGVKIRAYPFSIFRHKLHYSWNTALVGRWRWPEEKSYLDVWKSWEPGALVPWRFAFPVSYCKTTVPCPTTRETHSNNILVYNNYLRNSSILK